jgi:leucyl-tRNA synthetase
MIYCERCGWVSVPEEDLPVLLPEVEHYEPTDTGESPLANISAWVQTTCPECSGPARRETDTMPNWAGSNWYYLRFTDPHNRDAIADMDKLRYWMPVDVYIGGDEHNTLHLLYSRFIYQFLHDIGAVPQDIPEPYQKRLSHGVILGPDGARMSKSHGNVIVPDEVVEQYGADALRMYLMFMGPFDATLAWNERAMLGVKRFLDRLERWVDENIANKDVKVESSPTVRRETNRLIRLVAEDIEAYKFNTAIAKIMEALNAVTAEGERVALNDLKIWARVLAPFAPFLADKIWQRLGGSGSVHAARWPRYVPEFEAEEKVEISIQVNGKLRGTLWVEPDEPEESIKSRAAALDSVARHLERGEVRKVIVVPSRTVNFVVK